MSAPKITYYEEDNLISPKQENKPKKGGFFIAFFLILAIIMGLAGGFFGVVFLSTNSTLKAKLGLKDINVNTTNTEKLVLEESSAVIDATKKISPAVVSIMMTSNVQDYFGRTYQQSGGGTGFIITSDGLILTNKHVVSDVDASYTVFTSDGKDYAARIIATDPYNDLAIIKIDTSGLPVAELGDSSKVEIGQWVIAVGNALAEFQNSITLGIISGKDRKVTASGGGSSEQLVGLLQTDAAISSGNSGGPLVNLKGQVIGINTAVSSEGQNIGFAIPINSAKKAIESVEKTGKIVRPMIGVRYVNLTKEIAKANNLSADHGALVYHGAQSNEPAVVSGSPADKAGIRENDIITAINGEEINENNTLTNILSQYNPGDEVELTIMRDGKEMKTKIVLGEQN